MLRCAIMGAFDNLDDDLPEYPAQAGAESDAQAGPPPDSGNSPGAMPAPLPVASDPSGSLPDEAYADEISRESIEPSFADWHADADRQIAQHTHEAEPLDLTKQLYRGKPLPIELLPEAIQDFVQDCVTRTGIDGAAFAMGAFAALSTVCNDGFKLQPKKLDTRWRVHPVIWPIAVGPSSCGKTPGMEEAMDFLKKLDAEEEIHNIRKRLDYAFEEEKYAEARRIAKKSQDGIRPQEPAKPTLRQLWVDKGTPEGVENVLTYSPKVGWYMDEVSGLINGIDRHAASGKGSGGREFVLRLYNGGRGKKTLSSGNSDIALSAVVSGGVTGSAMRKMAGDLESDGLLQRTFMANIRMPKLGQDAIPNHAVYARLEETLRTLKDGHGQKTLTLSDDALCVYGEFVSRLTLIMNNEENDALASHLGKWLGMVPRMMLIYHLSDLAHRGQQPNDGEQIQESTARRVCRLFMEWQLSHVQEFWNELMAEKTARKFAQSIAKYILVNPDIRILSFRDHIAKPHHRMIQKLKPWEIAEGINTLINAAWLTPIGTKLNSYRLAFEYDINQRIPEMFERQREEERELRDIRREELQQMRQFGTDSASGGSDD